MLLRKLFYQAKPLIPRRTQLALRRHLIRRKIPQVSAIWPIDPRAAYSPPHWQGWPDGKQFAVVLTHDVELQKGHDQCEALMRLEQRLGFRSSFNFVPERYRVSPALRQLLLFNGFEVGVHGLKHDGKLYQSREEFLRRAEKINRYIAEWEAVGFRSPAMHHNLDYIRDLNIEYDASTFDTDPFEPQSDGVGTIFPFRVVAEGGRRGYIELPYTLPQDFTLFVLLRQKTIDIWKQKVDWIAQQGGMVLLNVHPDYLNFGERSPGLEEFPAWMYEDLLNYIRFRYANQYWHVLPREIAQFWQYRESVATTLDSQAGSNLTVSTV